MTTQELEQELLREWWDDFFAAREREAKTGKEEEAQNALAKLQAKQ